MKRLFALALATLVAFAPLPASAVATITTAPLSATVWTDLGAGPMRIFGSGQNTRYAIADSAPATTDRGFAVGDTPTDVATTSHVWVISTNAQFSPTVTYAPTSSGTVTATNPSVGTNNATAPTSSTQLGCQDSTGKIQPNSVTNPCYVSGGVSQATNSIPINISTATTTQLVALSGSTSIQVTSYDVLAAGTGNITLEYGTGTNCGTGTTALTGPYNLTAQTGIAKGNGLGPVLVVPSGKALCALTSAGVQMSGSVSYLQF